MLPYINFIVLYTCYVIIIRIRNIVRFIPFSKLIKYVYDNTNLREFNIGLLDFSKKVLCVSNNGNFQKKFKDKLLAETAITDVIDDFENINIDEKKNENIIYKKISEDLSVKDFINKDYVIINLLNPSVYELKYIYDLLFFYILYDDYVKLQKKYKTLLVDTKDCIIYNINC
jgi:hypothetical protein